MIQTFLELNGFSIINKVGSHRTFHNKETGIMCPTCQPHQKEFPLGTIKNIIQNSKIPLEEWKSFKESPKRYKKLKKSL